MVTSLAPVATFGVTTEAGRFFFGLVAISTLLALLFVREVAAVRVRGGWRGDRLVFLLGAINAPIVCLLLVFAVIITVRAWQLL